MPDKKDAFDRDELAKRPPSKHMETHKIDLGKAPNGTQTEIHVAPHLTDDSLCLLEVHSNGDKLCLLVVEKPRVMEFSRYAGEILYSLETRTAKN